MKKRILAEQKLLIFKEISSIEDKEILDQKMRIISSQNAEKFEKKYYNNI